MFTSAKNSSLFMTFIKSLVILTSLLQLALAQTCPNNTRSCSPIPTVPESPHVRFPFRLLNRNDPPRCGYPGFDLSCNYTLSGTIIKLPSGIFTVRKILYDDQKLTIDDPFECLPKRLIERRFSVEGTPFRAPKLENFTFLNCSMPLSTYQGRSLKPIKCLSDENYKVVAFPTELFWYRPAHCEVLATALGPVAQPRLFYRLPDNRTDVNLVPHVELEWNEPSCSNCDGDCGLVGESGLEVGCVPKPKLGLSHATKILLIGISIASLIVILVVKFGLSRVLNGGQPNNTHVVPTPIPDNNNNSSTTQANNAVELNQVRQTNNNNNNTNNVGLAKAVIETYPKSLVGESPKLLSSNYKMCPICLSEYRTNDTLRTLPDCFHYFHADCVDEWLKMNASCPLCRNLPLMSPSIAF